MSSALDTRSTARSRINYFTTNARPRPVDRRRCHRDRGHRRAIAQQGGELGPPTTIISPPRDFGPGGAPTTYFWDPDIIAVDPSFNHLAQPNTAIKRLYTGLLWAEGPAWSAQGRYLLWSDISQ
jgi:hypothetical protein